MIGWTNAIGGGNGGSDISDNRRIEITVVGGTTRPESVKNNTIWLNTDVNIPSWQISYQEPENPETGMVWIEINYETDIKMDLATTPFIIFGIGTSYQYINDEWSAVSAEIYTDGHYYASNLVLYNTGRYNNAYEWSLRNPDLIWSTGEYVNTKTGAKDVVLTNKTNYINMAYNGHNPCYSSFSIYYTSAIDVTDYSYLSITYECTKTQDARTMWFSVTPEKGTKTVTYDNATALISWNATTAKSKRTDTIDISSLSGDNYVNIGSYSATDKVNSCTLKIYAIELIKGAVS